MRRIAGRSPDRGMYGASLVLVTPRVIYRPLSHNIWPKQALPQRAVKVNITTNSMYHFFFQLENPVG